MPSAASIKPEKAPLAEASGVPPPTTAAADNSPIRQILVIIEHKIRNLEKRKSKLISYRDLQKSGKELNADQKVAVAKYDEVAQTLEFARDMCKQVTSIAVTAEREAKKQAKKEAWVRTSAETMKIRDALLVLDCLVQMGSASAREDFLKGTNGAAKLTEQDLKILDDLYPEVTPQHEQNEEGLPGFPAQAVKAAEHLYSIIDGKPKEILGTTYTHIKDIVTSVHECGYFDKSEVEKTPAQEEEPTPVELTEEEAPQQQVEMQPAPPLVYPPPPHTLPSPAPLAPAPAVVPAPAYPLRPLPPITLQEVEHAYFSQQYAQQRPITEVIGSQNFFFLQESEIDSPTSTPQPPPQVSPGAIPTQTFTNQNYIQMPPRVAPEPGVLPPQPHFPAPADLAAFPAAPLPPRPMPPHHLERLMTQQVPHPMMQDAPLQRDEPQAPAPENATLPAPAPTAAPEPPLAAVANDDEWSESPDPEDPTDKPPLQGDGDAQNRRNRRFGGGRGINRNPTNGYRGRGGNRQSGDGYQGRSTNDYQGRQSDGYQGRHSDGYQGRQSDGYQGRQSDGYQGRQNDGYQGRQNNGGYQGRSRDDNYHGRNDSRNRNGDQANQDNPRDKFDSQGGFQGGFKSRGRGGGGPRGSGGGGYRGGQPRSVRPSHYNSKQNSNAE